MIIGGLCNACGRYSPVLTACRACGSGVCHSCVDPKTGYCRLCGGMRRIK